jgi:7-keto-8-aminopelargonate synthetase-like enzyme
MNDSKAIEAVDQIINSLKEKKIAHLNTSDEYLDGNYLTFEQGRKAVNFGSCSYLGLEFEDSLKVAAKQSVDQFGTQFSSSRAYISLGFYSDLENKLESIFRNPVIVTPTTTLGHMSAIPVLVGKRDAVILDHQVHTSVNNAVKLVKADGTHVEMLRHNRMDLLEKRIADLSRNHEHVWYMGDGIYSMFGDCAPIHEIEALLNRHEKFHYYVDDAHGMSCFGDRGQGFVLSEITQHSKMVVATSFAKAFATGGGALIFPTEEMADKVRNCGSTLITSGPMQPSALGAAIAAAEIHLSPKLAEFQTKLKDNIRYTHSLLEKLGLPNLAEADSPIFFVGVGLPKIGYRLIEKMLSDGFMLNIGIFPAVPLKNTGVRFTITALHTIQQIEEMVSALAKNFWISLNEENSSIEDIYKAFKIQKEIQKEDVPQASQNLKIERLSSIIDINKDDWNKTIGKEGAIDWNGMNVLENSFSDNESITENWTFDYLIVRNQKDEILLSTFLTSGLMKDDMLADSDLSRKMEEIRKNDLMYGTSKFLSLGSLVTEGSHLYLKGTEEERKTVMAILFKLIETLQEEYHSETIMLRDFNDNDLEMDDFMIDNGFVKMSLQENFAVDLSTWTKDLEFLDTLSKRSKKHFKQNVRRFMKFYETSEVINPSPQKLEQLYELYLNVQQKGVEINTFKLPLKLFKNMALNPQWEILELNLLPDEKNGLKMKKTVGVVFAYKGQHSFVGGMVGVDYEFNREYGVYRQLIYRFIERAQDLNYNTLDFGFCAGIEKKKFGAKGTMKVAYIQTKDNFNFEALLTNSFGKEVKHEPAFTH